MFMDSKETDALYEKRKDLFTLFKFTIFSLLLYRNQHSFVITIYIVICLHSNVQYNVEKKIYFMHIENITTIYLITCKCI